MFHEMKAWGCSISEIACKTVRKHLKRGLTAPPNKGASGATRQTGCEQRVNLDESHESDVEAAAVNEPVQGAHSGQRDAAVALPPAPRRRGAAENERGRDQNTWLITRLSRKRRILR